MWFIGVEVEQETSAPPPKKILDPPLTRTYLFQNADNIYPHSSACWLKRFVFTEYN